MKLISGLFVLALLVSGCSSEDGNNTPTSPSANVPFSITDIRVGTGAEAVTGRAANVNYALWLYSTTAADNKGRSIESGNFTIQSLGTGTIPGFAQGVQGMRVGGLRRVVVPPNLAYGSAGTSSIPGNSTLIFEIELLAVQ